VIASTMSCSVRGLDGVPVTVEADVANGLPKLAIVGMTDRAIQEARERVRAAIRNAGFEFPQRRVTVNLAPAEVPKEGTGFDLAIALAVLRAGGRQLKTPATAFLGELSLDGRLRPVPGVLPMARCLIAHGVKRLIVPTENAAEAALVEGLEVFGVEALAACIEHLEGGQRLARASKPEMIAMASSSVVDLAEVRGQAQAKRCLEIAAAGGHNVLMTGPPGAGKTMLAQAFSSLLPDLGWDDALEVAAVYSLRGAFRERADVPLRPPFRAPHHSVSRAGLVGGGSGLAMPGEISLAHRGVLFLDELYEFPRAHLEALRQPLEDRSVTVVRARGAVRYPASFILLAAANPCPCGHLGDDRGCSCSPRQLDEYGGRLSGPIKDRIDLVVSVPRVRHRELFDAAEEEASPAPRSRVEAARARQQARNSQLNARLSGRDALSSCRLSGPAQRMLGRSGERLHLSARAYFRVLRVARTIADLGGEAEVGDDAIGEALRYRCEAAA
jgi:magnesium chelatase family protein